MFDKTYVGKDVLGTFSAPAALQSWSRVTVQVDDDTSYTAGTDTGRTLTVSIPYGTEQMAKDILARIRGQSYQPFDASTALLDPAAELGDAVEVMGAYGGLYKRARNFDSLYGADIAAPGDEEINHEYPYKSSQQREIIRQRKETKASLQVLTDKIALEVSAREEQGRQLAASITVQADRITQEVTDRTAATDALSSQITQQAGEIAAKVSKTGGSNASFGWSMTDTSQRWYANGSLVMKVDKSGVAVKGRIEALTGKIGGFDILSDRLSYNAQTWGGTNTTGIYQGPKGIQCGSAANGVQITSDGKLYAEEGHFRGSVYAGNIQYGEDAGYFDGGGISTGSISGGQWGQIGGGTISTINTSGGINASLGYADYANGVFSGWNVPSRLIVSSLTAQDYFYFGNVQVTRQSVQVMTGPNSYRNITFLAC